MCQDKFKLPTFGNYESLAIREEEKKVHLNSVKLVLKFLCYAQHVSYCCSWMWILHGAVYFSIYLCYTCSIFDRGKRVHESILVNANTAKFVYGLVFKLGSSSALQFMYPIMFLLVNASGSGVSGKLFLQTSHRDILT